MSATREDKREYLSIEFKFPSDIDSLDFARWYAAHKDAEPEQLIAHAKAHGAIRATLGDGTQWELKP